MFDCLFVCLFDCLFVGMFVCWFCLFVLFHCLFGRGREEEWDGWLLGPFVS